MQNSMLKSTQSKGAYARGFLRIGNHHKEIVSKETERNESPQKSVDLIDVACFFKPLEIGNTNT